MDIEINRDVKNLRESSTLWINSKVKKMRAEGEEIVHFGFGQSPFPVHQKLIAALQKNSFRKDYLPILGLLELRENICSYYKHHFNYNFSPSEVIIGPGSKELLFQALFSLEGTVITPAPSWVSYGPQVNIRGKHISKVLTKVEDDYKLKPEALQSVCETLTSNQKILIINSPNNPSGCAYDDEEIKKIVEVCKKNNIIIFSDEIYAQVDFRDKPQKGFFHFYPEKTIVTAGLSKAHSAGGYRMGFLATSKKMKPLVDALSSLISETFSAVCAPIQYAAVTAYSIDPDIDEYVKDCTQIHKGIAEYVYAHFKKLNLDLPKPQGGFYLMPNFNRHREQLKEKYNIENSVDLATTLLEKKCVATLPGCDFYYPPDALNLRIATVDYDGDKVYSEFIKNNKKIDEQFIESFCPNIKLGIERIKKFLA